MFTLEHSRTANQIDLGICAAASVGLAAWLIISDLRGRLLQLSALAAMGMVSWTLIEYGVHRFVLHGVKPFSTWHSEHHRRPTALIYSPTILSVLGIVALIFVPARLVGGVWRGTAFTFGIVVGNFCYAMTHHAVHHWRARGTWILRRKRWHAVHHGTPHRLVLQPGYYGVTTSMWDHVFGSDRRQHNPHGEALDESS
ncbi:MAG: sterol desaturase family protein [Steroidobacteraceae bacterium]